MAATLLDMGSQSAFATLYLTWDRVRDHGALDGYVRRIMVNEHNSLWRRAWKRRERSTDNAQQYVVRLGLDGAVERVAGPVTVESGTPALRVTPGRVG